MTAMRVNRYSKWIATDTVLILGGFFTLVPVFSELNTFGSKSGPIGTVLLVAGTITFGLCVGFKTRNSSD